MALEWRLREIMTERQIKSGAELGRRLQDTAGYRLSAPSICALMKEQPRLVKADTMDALCMTLSCMPSDLWIFTPTSYEDKKREDELRPV